MLGRTDCKNSTGLKKVTSSNLEASEKLQQELENSPEKPQRAVNKYGTCSWKLNDKLRREDGPAVETVHGDKYWVIHGSFHRLDGPAVEYADESKMWWVGGKLHRVDGTAKEWPNGDKEWLVGGECHRVDGPAVERAGGCKEWWVKNIQTNRPHLCKKAVLPTLTREDFYALCLHEDYVVRQLALHNPLCPAGFKIAEKLTCTLKN